jgi:hypothetical protein
MNTTTQERKAENRGPHGTWLCEGGIDNLRDTHITISHTGRIMPYRRASGLSWAERSRVRNGEIVVIGGCPQSGGTTWRQVVYRRGRYRTHVPSPAVAGAVDSAVAEWELGMLMHDLFPGDE